MADQKLSQITVEATSLGDTDRLYLVQGGASKFFTPATLKSELELGGGQALTIDPSQVGTIPITGGGTGATSAAAARTALGLAIGLDVQAHDAVLDATTASFTVADQTKLDGIEAGADVTVPGGSDTQVQYNNGGALGGDADLEWDDVNKVLTLGGTTATAQFVLPVNNDPTAPTLQFGSTGLGFYAASTSTVVFAQGGQNRWIFDSFLIHSAASYGGAIVNQNSSLTVPGILPDRSNYHIGIGSDHANTGALIAGDVTSLAFTTATSAVNYAKVTPSATGAPITIEPDGSDANVDFALLPKGTGVLRLDPFASATTPANFTADTYLHVKDAAGTSYYIAAQATSPW